MNPLHKKILTSLIKNTELTSYGLSKLIKKSIPSIEYALLTLVEVGVVQATQDNGKTLYSIHPFFKNAGMRDEVGSKIVDILQIIGGRGGPLTPKGYIIILESIISSIDMKDSY